MYKHCSHTTRSIGQVINIDHEFGVKIREAKLVHFSRISVNALEKMFMFKGLKIVFVCYCDKLNDIIKVLYLNVYNKSLR
jgi:hypothetical protein